MVTIHRSGLQCLLQTRGGLSVILKTQHFTETSFLISSFSLSSEAGSTGPHPIPGEDDDPRGGSPPMGEPQLIMCSAAPRGRFGGGTTLKGNSRSPNNRYRPPQPLVH